MMRALSTAATGMQGQEMRLDQISHDLANMHTTAYKRGRTEFQDLMYQNVKDAGGPEGSQSPVGVQVGSGTKVAAQYAVHEPGPIRMTNGLFDLLINGEGFFTVQMPNGTIAYTRDGAFKMNAQGQLTTSSGYLLVPNIQVPPTTAGVTITGNGTVRAMGIQGGEQDIGQITIVNFINPAALKRSGENLYEAIPAAGPPVQGVPGENGLGMLQQGALEASNVKPTESIMDMIATQRAYETNAKIMTVGDQMWSATNNIVGR